jgi:hypothetical protein
MTVGCGRITFSEQSMLFRCAKSTPVACGERQTSHNSGPFDDKIQVTKSVEVIINREWESKVESENEKTVISKASDLSVLGFRKVDDKFHLVPKVVITIFISLFLLSISYAFVSLNFQIPHFQLISLTLMGLTLIIGGVIVGMRRSCPKCHKRMKKIVPNDNDYFTTYKHYCPKCKIYVDTNVTNSKGD